MVTISKENSNIAGKNLASVKISTHSSNEPMLSLTEVKILSNPTIMTVIIGPMIDYNNIVIFLLPSLSMMLTCAESGKTTTGIV